MKKLLTLLLLSPLAFADYEEMISLEDYVAENSLEDEAVIFYVTTRCSGLFSVAASLSAPESDNYQRFLTTAEKFYAVSIKVRETIDPNMEAKEHEDKTFKTVCAEAKVRRLPVYMLRHTWGSNAVAAGVPLDEIKDRAYQHNHHFTQILPKSFLLVDTIGEEYRYNRSIKVFKNLEIIS